MNFFDRCCKSSLGRWKRNRSWHKWTGRMSLVLKSFINNLFIMKSRNLSCHCLIGSTSRPYNKIGIHFVDTSWRITSSDTICPIFPKILLNARSREHLTVRNYRYTPRYRISEVHGMASWTSNRGTGNITMIPTTLINLKKINWQNRTLKPWKSRPTVLKSVFPPNNFPFFTV